MTREKMVRIVLVAALVGGWVLLRAYKPQWAQAAIWPWVSMRDDHGWWVPVVGFALWGALLLSFLWTMYGPGRSRSMHDAQALGCIGIAAMGVGVILLLLVMGVLFRVVGLVNLISYMAVLLAVFIVPQYVWAKVQDWRKARHR